MTEPELDLSHIHWSSPEWIYHLPTRTLSNPDEALDYFALSPFWDVKSNNHALRTQRRVFDPLYGAAQERLDLPSFRGGFEYVVSHSRAPSLYLIQRREVQSDGSRVDINGMFFILDGKVYLAPSLFDVINTRLKNANHLLVEAFASLSASRPPANPRIPSSWRSLPPPTASTSTAGRLSIPLTPMLVRQDSMEATASVTPNNAATADDPSLDEGQSDLLLYNALQASRSKLEQLGKQARQAQNPSPENPGRKLV
ncbi:MED6 mediator sub complex component-domain-containing protein [Kockovaella imperatae]|uniref:Mediator of RNA polymerase II transcription subunit 6 n=1 Tax=Kockovaella imperatae TaxID=4999 RepID=A0A1Y1UGB1_9TREE|nr:MED6 mediator sub complex component-domain-containing protein [Kockovaella imperatae]ORX36567.1 MED6 mediator sub complex component-domain-containing protein [Kockovaella imperatae]